MRLANDTLSMLPQNIITPVYEREQLKIRIAHLGFGAFHRAHQAVCADKLAAEHGSDWGYCEINLIGGEQQIRDLRQQDLLWSVTEMDGAESCSRVVGVARQVLHAELDGIEAVLAALSLPDIAIVSITVTEKGYCYLPSTGQLNNEHPLIVHDLKHPEQPRSLPGVIVAALRRRWESGKPPFSVMSCDNMPENGHVTRSIVLQLAAQQSHELADWIAKHVTFPSTMVDRIVPATTDETLALAKARLTMCDPAAVACEPFFQWVIEDNFVRGRPKWEKAGAELVSDVLPFEEMKLRMLNGSHSFLAYLGYLAGYQYIDECMQDANYVAAVRQLMLNEQATTLRVPEMDLTVYADSLLKRYLNIGLKHRTWQIAMDGTLKLPQRMLDSIRVHIVRGTRFDWLALGVAGWMRYISGVDDTGNSIEVSDPQRDTLARLVAGSADGAERVSALLSLRSVFGDDLPLQPLFVQQVTDAYCLLQQTGAKQAVAQTLQVINQR